MYAASDRFIETITAAVDEAETPADGSPRRSRPEARQPRGRRVAHPLRVLVGGLRDEPLNDADHALDRRQVGIYLGILEGGVAAGVFHPRIDIAEVAWALVALEDGLVMDILAGTKTHGEVTALIRSVAEALLDVCFALGADGVAGLARGAARSRR